MKRNWLRSKYDGTRGRWASLYATINPQGHIFLTAHTLSQLGDPTAFEMLWEPANSTIGMLPANEQTENPYPALKRSGHGGRVVRAHSFLHEFGIRLDKTVRFPDAEIDEEGILILDLRKVTPAAKPKRKGTS